MFRILTPSGNNSERPFTVFTSQPGLLMCYSIMFKHCLNQQMQQNTKPSITVEKQFRGTEFPIIIKRQQEHNKCFMYLMCKIIHFVKLLIY